MTGREGIDGGRFLPFNFKIKNSLFRKFSPSKHDLEFLVFQLTVAPTTLLRKLPRKKTRTVVFLCNQCLHCGPAEEFARKEVSIQASKARSSCKRPNLCSSRGFETPWKMTRFPAGHRNKEAVNDTSRLPAQGSKE